MLCKPLPSPNPISYKYLETKFGQNKDCRGSFPLCTQHVPRRSLTGKKSIVFHSSLHHQESNLPRIRALKPSRVYLNNGLIFHMFSVHEDGVLSRCSTLPNIMMSACDAWGLQSALSTQQIPEVKKKL